MTKYAVPDNQLKKAIAASDSILNAIKLLDIRVTGSAYATIRKRIEDLDIDISHWKINKAGRKGKTKPLDEILIKNSDYRYTGALKRRLVRAGLLEYYCHTCGIRDWQTKSIALHLDHINGDRKDNRIENLRLLCPNCHSQTPTYGVKNKQERSSSALDRAIKAGKKKIKNKSNFCGTCGKGITREAELCKSCRGKVREPTKVEWPEINTLVQNVRDKGYKAVGQELGVSDNAVRKHIKNHS